MKTSNTPKHLILQHLILGLAFAAPATAAADAAPAKPIADLEYFVGTWKGAGTLTMGTTAAKVQGTWSCKRTSGKVGVLCALRVTGVPGLASYEETDLLGYDPHSNTYHWFSVTNAGETHDHVAKLPDGNKLQFVYSGTQGGKPLKEVIDLDLGKDGKTLGVRTEQFVGGASAAVFEVKFRK